MSSPFVAVAMVTYNHEKFIAHAIDSILMQKTNFPFRIYIGEDCSTDKTREICLSYANKYPDRISLFLNKTHHFRKNSSTIYSESFKSGAKYIAMLDGDDYWTDPNKLSKQVEFLEANPDYAYCCTRIQILDNNTGEISPYLEDYFSDSKDKIVTFSNFYSPFVTHTATVLFRSDYLSGLKNITGKYFVDLSLYTHLLTQGKGYCFNWVSAVYRFTGRGMWSGIDIYNRQRNAYFISYNICLQYKSRYKLLKEFHRHNFNMLSFHLHQRKSLSLFFKVFFMELYLYAFTRDKYSLSVLFAMMSSSFRGRFARLFVSPKAR